MQELRRCNLVRSSPSKDIIILNAPFKYSQNTLFFFYQSAIEPLGRSLRGERSMRGARSGVKHLDAHNHRPLRRVIANEDTFSSRNSISWFDIARSGQHCIDIRTFILRTASSSQAVPLSMTGGMFDPTIQEYYAT